MSSRVKALLAALLVAGVALVLIQAQQRLVQREAAVPDAFIQKLRHGLPPPITHLSRAEWEAGARPAPDEYGDPLNDVDKRELIALLEAKRYDELEAKLDALWADAQRDIRNEQRLVDAYFAFGRVDPAFQALVEAWIIARPGGFAPQLAAAEHYFERAQDARGTRWAKDTSAEQFKQMEALLERAHRYLANARAESPDHLFGYYLAFMMERLHGWSAAQEELLGEGLGAHPASFLLRSTAQDNAEPRWGGSYETMQGIAIKGQAHLAENPRLRSLLGAADAEAAYDIGRDDRYAEAIALYDRALKHGASGVALRERGQLWLFAGDPGRALHDADGALRFQPQGPLSLNLRGRALFWLGLMAPTDERAALLEASAAAFELRQQIQPFEKEALEWTGYLRYARHYCVRDPLPCGRCRAGDTRDPLCDTVERLETDRKTSQAAR